MAWEVKETTMVNDLVKIVLTDKDIMPNPLLTFVIPKVGYSEEWLKKKIVQAGKIGIPDAIGASPAASLVGKRYNPGTNEFEG